jgi:hypothetical protein
MRIIIVTFILLLTAVCSAGAEWVKFHKNKFDGSFCYYNKDKIKNSGGMVTLWLKIDDGFPGKMDIDCKKLTYKSITNVVNEIAPDTMMESLAKIVCQEKSEPAK